MASFGSLFFGGLGIVPNLIQFPVILTVVLIAPRVIHDYGVKLIAEDYAINTESILDLRPETYDFILVGAGSAGAVVANRLSSPPNNFSVLVLEAGGDQNFVTRPPMFDFFVANNSMIDWKYLSVPQKKSCFSCVNQSFTCPRGKALGGCSTINWMIYIRGNQKGFDDWARETGDDQWNSTNVLKYFKRSENYIGTFPDDDYHGCGGELFVDRIYYDSPSRDVLVKSLIKNENFTLKDLNKNQTRGFMELDTTINRGLRASTYEAFIKPILDRPNLRIYRYSNVTQLLFDPIDRTKVIGVKYFRQNVTEPKYAYARREVIVSAGAINSAALLLQSGIGPRADLEDLNIPVVKDLPVGKTLYDHPTVLFPILFEKPRTSLIFERDVMIDMVLNYDPPARVGPMGAPNVFATGYYSTPLNDDVHHPDMQHTLTYCGLTQFFPQIFVPFTNYPREVMQEYLRGYLGRDGNIVITTLVRPKSVGSVTLNRTSIYGMPLIDLNYFSDPEDYDLEAMISGMMNLIDFYEKSPAYAEIGARFFPRPLPACRHHRFRSKDYFRCHVQHFTMSLFHFSGTCKMGKLGDPAAVTDSKLRVQGIKNLRVVDASVMPIITNGNTNAPTIMIGELGSDIILRDHGGVTIHAGSQKPCPYISTTFP